MAEVVRLFGRDRFLRIRYEDLIASPLEQLECIEKFAGVSLEEVKRRARGPQPFDVSHNIGGNHMRMAGSFVLDPKKASRQGLPKRYSLMAHALCWPLLWKYGYFNAGKRKGHQGRE